MASHGGGGWGVGSLPPPLPPPSLQLAGLFSCTVVLSVLLWLGPFFYYLPKVRSRGGMGLAGTGGWLDCRSPG